MSLAFVWPYELLFLIAYIWAFPPEFRIIRNEWGSASKDRRSMTAIMFGMLLALLLAFLLAALPLAFVKPLRFPAAATLPAFWSGLALLVAGSLLRRHSSRVLGDWFTGNVQAPGEQPVIERGAYRWIRHPSYAAGILVFTGLGLTLANWASVAILVAASVAVYAYRITVEERALRATIGEPYAAYMRRTKRLVPFVI